MQDSRLEKFIYAICSMEVSDLPAPLSRIETLWNCLITGETPDFKPLSRNEYYLMAMIGMYGVEELPTPLSRGEKLLYKIAMGDTELSDIPAYLSRYEELLGYLVENGGVGNFEYVLYTLNERVSTLYLTVEKPMKQAVFKGDTLVNDLPKPSLKNEMRSIGSQKLNNGYDNVNVVDGKFKSAILKGMTETILDRFENGTYNAWSPTFIKGDNTKRIRTINQYSGVSGSITVSVNEKYEVNVVGHNTSTSTGIGGEWQTTLSIDVTNSIFAFVIRKKDGTDITKDEIHDVNLVTSFKQLTDMVSVRMPVLTTTGKNLYDPNNGRPKNLNFFYNNEQKNELASHSTMLSCSVQITKGKKYSLSFSGSVPLKIHKSGQFEEVKSGCTSKVGHHYTEQTITAQMNGYWVIMFSYTEDGVTDNWTQNARDWENELNLMIVEDDTPSSYEPYKSNILSTPNDLELRGIGDIKDELDLLTGGLTQKVENVLITEDEVISLWSTTSTEHLRFFIQYAGVKEANCICNQFINDQTQTGMNSNFESIACIQNGFTVVVLKNKLNQENVNGFKEWLKDNPLFITYQLEQEVHKTVDLTTIDQDGTSQEAFHSFNNGILNVSSQGLLPIIKYEVPTNNSYYLPDKLALNTLYTSRGSLPSTAIIDGQTLTLSTNGTFTTPSSITNNLMVLSDVVDNLMFILGDQTAKEFGYFEGMQSVKMPVLTTYGDNIFDNDNIIVGSYYNYDGNFSYHATSVLSTTYISIEPDAQLISNISRSSYQIIEYDSNKNFITRQNAIPNIPATLSSNTRYVRFSFYDCGVDFDCYIRKGTIKPLVYEPYKSNILSTPEDVELRGIGEVKDELDLMTGEMTQRIESLILDGINHKLTKTTYEAGRRRFDTDVTNLKIIGNGWVRTELVATSDKLIPCDFYTAVKTMSPCLIAWKNMLAITLEDESIDTVDKANNYLQNNPIEIQYVLDTPVHKTVDLSIVDQDGQPTKLKTFDDVTHVSIQVNDITPEVALEVSTKIEKALMATPSNEDDILNEQSRLIETVKKQTEDADATMMATTEIYEQIL